MTIKSQNDEINRLRFVYSDAVVSMPLPANATLSDVARSFETLAPSYDDSPIAVDITIAANGDSRPWRKIAGGVTASFNRALQNP